MEPWLQYGAMGVLAATLGALGVGARAFGVPLLRAYLDRVKTERALVDALRDSVLPQLVESLQAIRDSNASLARDVKTLMKVVLNRRDYAPEETQP